METPWIVSKLWLIPFFPFLAAGFTALLRQPGRKKSMTIAIAGIGMSFLLSLCAISHLLEATSHGHHEDPIRWMSQFNWFTYGHTAFPLGFLLDPLTGMMLLVVSGVSLLVFIFSTGYMQDDPNETRFFCFLSLFAGSMLLLVISNSLLLLFMAWELVGLSSFLLIGFWYHKPSAVAAMKKAFITTRIGDVGFLIGILWFYSQTGSTLFYTATQDGALEATRLASIGIEGAALAIALLIFCGAVGKSGQFPLHVWLPDAMEGPTPVSALIHAATMVAAGVFLVGRMMPVFELNPVSLEIVAMIGAFTALFAATIAVTQWDIKRILAYSTVSQLGYMIMGLGVGGYVAGLFHLFTHAFFKALLFLGSGSIIHACHHEQDIRKMGGLKDRMPITHFCYMIGMLALSGFPLFAGFFSKDELLLGAWNFHAKALPEFTSKIPFIFGMAGAFLTAFYMARQIRYVFWGKARGHGAEHAHECGPTMTWPLIVLAFMSIATGFLGLPGHNWFHHYLAPGSHEHAFSLGVMICSIIIVLVALGSAWKLYSGSVLLENAMDPFEKHFPALFKVLHHKYYIDEFYQATFISLNTKVSRFLFLFDRIVIHGCILLASGVIYILSTINQMIDNEGINKTFDAVCNQVRSGTKWTRKYQDGFTQHYLQWVCIGFIIIFLVLTILIQK